MAGRDRDGRAVCSWPKASRSLEDDLQLWPKPAPSRLNATVGLSLRIRLLRTRTFRPPRTNSFHARTRAGPSRSSADRTGGRFPYLSAASLLLNQAQTATTLSSSALGGRAIVISAGGHRERFDRSGCPEGFTLVGACGARKRQMRRRLHLRFALAATDAAGSLRRQFRSFTRAGRDRRPARALSSPRSCGRGSSAKPELDLIFLPPATTTGKAAVTPFPQATAGNSSDATYRVDSGP